MRSIDEKINAAMSAGAEELRELIRESHPQVISNAVLNRHFTEDLAVIVAKKKTTEPETLGFLAGDVRFKDSYPLKLAICKNPKTPLRVALSLLKFIRIFDLADISRDHFVTVQVRQKVEFMIAERIPSLPLGIKTALARRAGANVLMALLESGDARLTEVCLGSPILTEGLLYKIINKPTTRADTIRQIAEHPRWSLGYSVRFALMRNFHTPTACVVKFVTLLKTTDLRELYADGKIPSSVKPFIFSELSERGETPEIPPDEVFDIDEEEDGRISDTESL